VAVIEEPRRPGYRTVVSEHFTLQELTVTSTGLPNVPGDRHVVHLRSLCFAVLEPWRAHVGPIAISSGFRSPAVNKAVGGEPDSQHLRGEAVDARPLRRSLELGCDLLVRLTHEGLPVDQAIFYVRAPGRGWVHVSHTTRRPVRRELLVHHPESGYLPWDEYRRRGRPLLLPG
jgi:zinc D-Ala-D-Ala carboxypeptidase